MFKYCRLTFTLPNLCRFNDGLGRTIPVVGRRRNPLADHLVVTLEQFHALDLLHIRLIIIVVMVSCQTHIVSRLHFHPKHGGGLRQFFHNRKWRKWPKFLYRKNSCKIRTHKFHKTHKNSKQKRSNN